MRKKLMVAAGVVAVWWMWPSHSRVAPAPQAAVLSDGWGVLAGNRLVEFEADGTKRVDLKTSAPADAHLVGALRGPAVVFRDGKQVVFANIDDEGELYGQSRFGRSVQKMCEQTATNDHKFGVAWTEPDGAVWFVHGPTSQAIAASLPTEDARQPSYCGIASADKKIALLWRDGDRTLLLLCGKSCEGYPARVAIDKKKAILGFGCTKDACTIVTQDDGTTEASWVKTNGKIVWTKPLPSACRDTKAAVVGLADHVAIAYSLGNEPVVRVADRQGGLKAVWQGGGDPDTVPTLAWSGGALFVAAQKDGELVTSVLR